MSLWKFYTAFLFFTSGIMFGVVLAYLGRELSNTDIILAAICGSFYLVSAIMATLDVSLFKRKNEQQNQ